MLIALSDIFCFIKINITHAHYILIKIYVLLLVSMLHYYYKQWSYRHFFLSFLSFFLFVLYFFSLFFFFFYKIVKGLDNFTVAINVFKSVSPNILCQYLQLQSTFTVWIYIVHRICQLLSPWPFIFVAKLFSVELGNPLNSLFVNLL